MQFRERRRVIQVIRTTYDPAVKRGRSEVVGKIDKDAPVIPEKLRKACTQAEVAEIETWLAERETALRTETIRDDTGTLAERMRRAADYFRHHATGSEGDEQAAVHAADIWLAWEDLKKAMRKAGYTESRLAEEQKERSSP
ncbi:hypothetical protein JL101_000865 [Skermanella rosea]|uniref:hypothetical protein n=1 Tax=Skermanella rosea TaxID=1817965 RepID=UPI001932EED6|nr:hypothetical protein [Skermanella rosea]UEM04024.1 hypothetical protein JL101_000865 [Skermanella rosea]